MAQLTGGSFKRISPDDIKTRRSTLNQLVDVIQEDVSGSATRRKYQVFVTGGIGPGVTSSLFQTVYDQDFTLQTSNPIFDMTIGLYHSGSTVQDCKTGEDSAGKLLFPSESVMMREKVDIYRQYAATLLGNADSAFFSPFGSTTTSTTNRFKNDRIDDALFISFKRLFTRDKIKRETFALRMYSSGVLDGASQVVAMANGESSIVNGYTGSNISLTSPSGSVILTDIGMASNIQTAKGGSGVGTLVNAADTTQKVGLVFYDAGAAVVDMSKVFFAEQHMSGVIGSMSPAGKYPTGTGGTDGQNVAAGFTILGNTAGNPNAKLVPDLLVSASIDDIVDHVASTRFQSGSLTSMTFQNITNINSTLIFCRATADEFNYSTNPTFTNTAGRIRVIDQGQEDTQRAFSFPTTVGLHDEFGNLIAVAKMSRPIEKNDEKDITFRIRLDF